MTLLVASHSPLTCASLHDTQRPAGDDQFDSSRKVSSDGTKRLILQCYLMNSGAWLIKVKLGSWGAPNRDFGSRIFERE